MEKSKPGTFVLTILLSFLSLTNESCRKKDLPAPLAVNTPPIVFAGADISLLLPLDSAFLHGSAYDVENNIASYRWSQLSGPNQASIQTADSLKTKILKLIKGEYSFELIVTDKGNATSRDTMTLTVLPDLLTLGPLQMQKFDSLVWGDSCAIRISNISPTILASDSIQVFLQRYYAGGVMAGPFFPSSGWFQIRPIGSSGFWYEIKNNVLVIHATANIVCDWDDAFYDVLVWSG